MIDLKVGVIGLPGKWSTEALADAVEHATGFRHVIDMAELRADLTTGAVYAGATKISDYDALLVKKISAEYNPNTLDRLELLRWCEHQGVRVMSPALNILRLIDRLSCTVTLRQHQIPMPPTTITESIDAAMNAVEQYGSAIFKPLYSTKARGMVVIDNSMNQQQRRQHIESFKQQNPMMYIQQKLDLSGRDMGLVFLGGEYLGAYARVAQTDSWNTTIHSGGKYQAASLSEDVIEMAFRAQQPFGMDFTTVDVAETATGPVVFEVSAFGGFRGAKDGIGIDAAKRYVDYAINQLKPC
ncbi:GAK system ATP-grasp enzyme [Neiella marina]|uniref:GAK system ATP-grasp enzyme n=1 Tax=Neiella holothuriorum TaxID=2870530 RepID=A0ABS7ED53_9GAMM|nr:GAK system ATP-grasp enzyme [Neiella holothuriorum]MBW8190243.1 GAK system ATP-grasp enzyme [Neiella holothuriorum]